MTKDIIEQYGTFNTKGCPDELIFGEFNNQPITSDYYNLLIDDDRNNVTGTPVDDALPDKKGLEDSLIPNDEDINYEIIIFGDDESLASDIDPSKTKFWILKEWTIKMKGGKMKERKQKMKEWKMKSYLLIKKDINHRILPPSSTMI